MEVSLWMLLVVSGLLVFPLGRRILKWWVVAGVALGLLIVGLMFASEPDLRG